VTLRPWRKREIGLAAGSRTSQQVYTAVGCFKHAAADLRARREIP